MRIVHTRTKRIYQVNQVYFCKAVIVDITLDRFKEWELNVRDFGFKAFNNKIGLALKDIKEQFIQLHKDYLDDKLDEEIKVLYADYIKPFFGRSQMSQKEFRASIKGFNKKEKERLKELEINGAKN